MFSICLRAMTESAGDKVELMDGGYCANNPTISAIAEATIALQKNTLTAGVFHSDAVITPNQSRLSYSELLNL